MERRNIKSGTDTPCEEILLMRVYQKRLAAPNNLEMSRDQGIER